MMPMLQPAPQATKVRKVKMWIQMVLQDKGGFVASDFCFYKCFGPFYHFFTLILPFWLWAALICQEAAFLRSPAPAATAAAANLPFFLLVTSTFSTLILGQSSIGSFNLLGNCSFAIYCTCFCSCSYSCLSCFCCSYSCYYCSYTSHYCIWCSCTPNWPHPTIKCSKLPGAALIILGEGLVLFDVLLDFSKSPETPGQNSSEAEALQNGLLKRYWTTHILEKNPNKSK